MSEGERPPEADAHAGTLPGIGQPAPAQPATAMAQTIAATQASVIDRRGIAQLATLPAGSSPHDSTIDMPHAETLAGPHVEADLPAMQKVPDNAYTIGEEIARGGMGKILSARDRRLRRDIVIKVTRGDRIDPRFEREALITARLQHPSIVRVYEAGLLGDGRAFYAMERVRGRSLEVIIDETPHVRDRLARLPHAIAVVDAIAYAHSEGVIHRDLKPSNVLIGPFGETVVIDWGLAKDMRAAEIADSLDSSSGSGSDSSGGLVTQVGSVMGTPSFMAPEQARGDVSDDRTDIYALGAMLYTLLSGVAPHRGRTTDEVLEQVAAGRRVPLAEREPTLPPELVTIVERAMAHKADDRYQSAKELADDLRAFTAGKLVASHTYSIWRLVRRFVRRHMITVGVAVFAIAVLAVVGALSLQRIVHARDEAAEAKASADVAREQAERNLHDLNRSTDEFYRSQAREWAEKDPSHTAAWLERLSDRALAEPESYDLAVAAAHRGFAWELRGHTADIEILAMSPDHSLVATASDDATIRIWSIAERKTVHHLVGHVGPLEDVKFSPDGKFLASGGTDGNVYLWDVQTGIGRKLAGHKNTVRGLAFSPDSKSLASTSEEGTVFVWDVTTGAGKSLNKRTHGWRPVVWSRDGKTIIAGGFDGVIGRFEPATGKSTLTPTTGIELRCFALSTDGTLLAAGDENGVVTLISGSTAKEIGRHTDVVRDIVFSPDDSLIVSGGGDVVIGVYAVKSNVRTELRGNTDGVKDLDVSPDGKFVVSAGIDGIARVWPLAGGPARELRGHGTAVKGAVFATTTHLVTASEDDNARIWQLDDAEAPPKGGPALRAWLAARTNVEVHTAPRQR